MLSVPQIKTRAWQLSGANLWFICRNRKATPHQRHKHRTENTIHQNLPFSQSTRKDIHFSHITKFELMFKITFVTHIQHRCLRVMWVLHRPGKVMQRQKTASSEWFMPQAELWWVMVPVLLRYLNWKTCSVNDAIPLPLQYLSNESFLPPFSTPVNFGFS